MGSSLLDRLLQPRSAPEARLAAFVDPRPPLLRAEGLLRAELARQLRQQGFAGELACRLAYAVQVDLRRLPSAKVRRHLALAAAARLAQGRRGAQTDAQWLARVATVRLRFPAQDANAAGR